MEPLLDQVVHVSSDQLPEDRLHALIDGDGWLRAELVLLVNPSRAEADAGDHVIQDLFRLSPWPFDAINACNTITPLSLVIRVAT